MISVRHTQACPNYRCRTRCIDVENHAVCIRICLNSKHKQNCKVALATLYIMYRVEVNLSWRIHCSGPNFTRIIYAVSKFHSVISTWSCVRGVCMCREAYRLARVSCHVGWVPKWHLKSIGKLFSGFLCCVEVSHDLDHLDVLYSIGIMLEVGVLDIAAHTFHSS